MYTRQVENPKGRLGQKRVSRYGCHSVTYSRFSYIEKQFRYDLDTGVILLVIQYFHTSRNGSDTIQIRMSFCYLFKIFIHRETVQIRSRYGCHSATHSRFSYIEKKFRYNPDTDVILLLIQDFHTSRTVQIRSR